MGQLTKQIWKSTTLNSTSTRKQRNTQLSRKTASRKSSKKLQKIRMLRKKPLTPFFIFSQEKRSEVVKAHPEMKLAQIGKKMGEMWQALSQEEKETYIAQQKKAKEVYKEVRAAYEQTEDFAAYQIKKNEWYEKKKKAQKEARKLHFRR